MSWWKRLQRAWAAWRDDPLKLSAPFSARPLPEFAESVSRSVADMLTSPGWKAAEPFLDAIARNFEHTALYAPRSERDIAIGEYRGFQKCRLAVLQLAAWKEEAELPEPEILENDFYTNLRRLNNERVSRPM